MEMLDVGFLQPLVYIYIEEIGCSLFNEADLFLIGGADPWPATESALENMTILSFLLFIDKFPVSHYNKRNIRCNYTYLSLSHNE